MRKMALFFILLLSLTYSCKKKANPVSVDKQEMTSDDSTGLYFSALLSNTDLPQNIDFGQSIDSLSLPELRILYNYVYATHGMHMTQTDTYNFFKTNTKWYADLEYKLWSDGKMPEKYSDVSLNADETKFVERIVERIAVLLKENYIQTGDYNLGNINNIVNLFQYTDLDPDFINKLKTNNFVITPGANEQLFHVYEENDYRQVPNFITTDLYLQAYHMYFSYILKSLEQQKFIPLLSDMNLGLYNEAMKLSKSDDPQIAGMAEYVATFYAIPYSLLTGKELAIPTKYKRMYQDEIKNIADERDGKSDFLNTDFFAYSLFKPRGHYTSKAEMKAYFKAMIWLQTAPFCRNNKEQLQLAIFSSILLNTGKTSANKPILSNYKAVYDPIVFLIGVPDNLSFMDIANYLAKENIADIKTAMNGANITKVDNMLRELAKTRNQIKPEIEITCMDKVNFMPQRYLIDNDIIQKMVDVSVNAKRAYPRGLDVFAALGSTSAQDVLYKFYKEPDNWSKYNERMNDRKAKFKGYNKWNSSIYNKWIESLLVLQQTDKNYPNFMQTKAWGYKNLNTSLASWAELKHDAILYAEQPFGAECGGGDDGPEQPHTVGYVEPNLKFWTKLSEMLTLTKNVLAKNNLMTPDISSKTDQLSDYVKFLIQVTNKQLSKTSLTKQEYTTIQYMGSSIEYFTLSVLSPEINALRWNEVKGAEKSIAVVADIYTRNIFGCEKNGILHVATGNANNIYVVVEIEGYLYLTKGAIFSYYEFVEPDIRLTDEEWQKRLADKQAPPIQKWMDGIILDKSPKTDERVFYSSGC